MTTSSGSRLPCAPPKPGLPGYISTGPSVSAFPDGYTVSQGWNQVLLISLPPCLWHKMDTRHRFVGYMKPSLGAPPPSAGTTCSYKLNSVVLLRPLNHQWSRSRERSVSSLPCVLLPLGPAPSGPCSPHTALKDNGFIN